MFTIATLHAWWIAARPKTLWAGAAPVLLATALAVRDGGAHFPSALAALAGALALQIAANYANDYFDFVKGADTPGRLGPVRVTQAGLLRPRTVLTGALATLALAFLLGVYIVSRGGWPFVVIGLLAMACAVLYTAGPFPLGYIGLGDMFVFAFFGPAAVCGTYYLQTGALTPVAITLSLAPGFLSVALLTVNNLRDLDEDRRSGKRTLVARFGRVFGLAEYAVCIAAATVAVPAWLYVQTGNGLLGVAALLTAAAGGGALRLLLAAPDGPAHNRVLALTGRLLLLHSLAFSAAWLLAPGPPLP
jgi:1,4-dihydroxy-2-naphthoate polyprenyltransferase